MSSYRYISPSALSLLLYSPRKWYKKYIENQEEREPETEAQLLGSIIHCLLLRPKDFEKEYVISGFGEPTESIKKIVDAVFKKYQELKEVEIERENLSEYEELILDLCKESNYNQHLKTDKQRIDKIASAQAYFDYLKSSQGKKLVSQENYEFCLRAVERIKSTPTAVSLLEPSGEDYYETLVQESYCKEFGLKGVIDHYKIDHNSKTIYISDLKTLSSKKLKDFPESVEYWGYNMQMAIYVYLLYIRYNTLLEQGYKVIVHFIVIDKDGDVYCFPVKESTLLTWLENMKSILEQVKWYFNNNRFNLPYDFERGFINI
jgi:hypothetical protein